MTEEAELSVVGCVDDGLVDGGGKIGRRSSSPISSHGRAVGIKAGLWDRKSTSRQAPINPRGRS